MLLKTLTPCARKGGESEAPKKKKKKKKKEWIKEDGKSDNC
jgi:hypothetical protein